ncbi:P-loop containing nucleoside triphosphate hydrolase protein, partial [Microdochium trichocladiopsis]
NPATFYYGNPDFYHLRKNTRTPEVCILGRSNVGKSSLVNAVANRMGSELARVSKKAGHTKTINAYGFGPAPRPEKGEVVLSDEFKGKEEMPKHMFFLVDMPGYGHGSLQEWGKNIALYLQKRTALKGAVMLIDAEVGPKESDWDAIELMANAGLRTAIVLTKADKVKSGNEGLLKTCRKVWDGIRRIESQLAESNKKWTWEKEFYVTASGAND